MYQHMFCERTIHSIIKTYTKSTDTRTKCWTPWFFERTAQQVSCKCLDHHPDSSTYSICEPQQLSRTSSAPMSPAWDHRFRASNVVAHYWQKQPADSCLLWMFDGQWQWAHWQAQHVSCSHALNTQEGGHSGPAAGSGRIQQAGSGFVL